MGERGRAARRWAAAVLAGAAWLVGPAGAEAGSLKNTVRDLYGGDGIVLQPTGHDAHFIANSLQGLDRLGSALAGSLGLFSLNSTVSGFTFDVERGVPVRTTESLGPLLAERAPTIGRGRFNLAVSYTRIDFSRFEGKSLDDLTLNFAHEDSNRDGILGPTPTFDRDFELDTIRVRLDLDVVEDVVALFGTYGVTSTVDVGVVVPIVHIRLRARADASIVRTSSRSEKDHQFGPLSDPVTDSGGGDETGIGDVILRGKWNFLRRHETWPDLAVLGEVKLPTGDEDDLLGTGDTNFRLLLVGSRTYGLFTPHANLGFEASTAGSEAHNLRYVLGVDARALPTLTGALEVIGRWEPAGDGIGDHTVDLAVGAKWNPVGSLILSANVQVPLNRNEGLRADVIWSLGLEYQF